MTLHVASPARVNDFRGDIQGLRAVAILLVVADHVGLPFLHGGYIGVDIFFVISGFLITSHLLSQLVRSGRISFADFYARRMRRILPAALLVALVTLIAGFVLFPPFEFLNLMSMAIATALYVPNMVLAANGTDYLAGTEPSPYQHYWSLGVEEQFYIVWPLLLLFVWRLVRRSRKGFAVFLVGIVVLGFIVSVVGLGVSAPWSFFSLPTRAWELGVGGIAALLLHATFGRQTAIVSGWVRTLVTTLGLALIVASAFLYTDDTLFPGTAALVPVTGAALVVIGGAGAAGPLQRLLSAKVMLYVGAISYSLYLWHWPLLVLPQAFVGLNRELPLWARLGLVLIALCLADLTYRFVETPMKSLPVLVRAGPRRSILAGIAGSIVVTSVALIAIPLAAAAPQSTERELRTVLPSDSPVFSTVVPANISPRIAVAKKSTSKAARLGCHIATTGDSHVNECEFGSVGSQETVAIFGDSHGGHWFAAVDSWATRNDYSLRSFTKAGCSTVLVTILDGSSPQAPCIRWRDKVLDRFREDPPDILLIANTSTLPFSTEGRTREEAWAIGVSELMDALPVTRVVVIANTPQFAEGIPRCLSHRLASANECGGARSEVIDQGWLDSEQAAFEARGASYLDLNDYFCSREWCGALVGNVLLYRDDSHITEIWSGMMSGPLEAALGGELLASTR